MLTAAVGLLAGRTPSVVVIAGDRSIQPVLVVPAWYVITSPFSRILDGLTLLSIPQTIAIWISVAILLVITAALNRARSGLRWWSYRLIALAIVVALVEAAVAFVPRPMARLRVDDPELAVVDFHSHTGFSHDVRKSFSVDDNRRWHESGGFDIAWITDHVRFGAEQRARESNPRVAGESTSLLVGVEGRYHRIISTVMLGLDARDSALLNKRGNLLAGVPASGRTPITIVAIPNRNLDSVTAASLDSTPHFVALELIDAAPRGLGQFDREEEKLRGMASALHLTLVAATNNHGFGRAVAGWNVIRIPEWRSITPDSAGIAIESLLRDRSQERISIVARNRPRNHDLSLPLTLPVLLLQIFGALSAPERVSWVMWIWGIALLIKLRRTSAAADSA